MKKLLYLALIFHVMTICLPISAMENADTPVRNCFKKSRLRAFFEVFFQVYKEQRVINLPGITPLKVFNTFATNEDETFPDYVKSFYLYLTTQKSEELKLLAEKFNNSEKEPKENWQSFEDDFNNYNFIGSFIDGFNSNN